MSMLELFIIFEVLPNHSKFYQIGNTSLFYNNHSSATVKYMWWLQANVCRKPAILSSINSVQSTKHLKQLQSLLYDTGPWTSKTLNLILAQNGTRMGSAFLSWTTKAGSLQTGNLDLCQARPPCSLKFSYEIPRHEKCREVFCCF